MGNISIDILVSCVAGTGKYRDCLGLRSFSRCTAGNYIWTKCHRPHYHRLCDFYFTQAYQGFSACTAGDDSLFTIVVYTITYTVDTGNDGVSTTTLDILDAGVHQYDYLAMVVYNS